VDERTDGDGEQQRADADRPTEQPTDREHDHLDSGANDPDRMAARGEAGHEPVARARSEAGTDVETRGDPIEHDAAREEGRPRTHLVGRRQDGERGVRGESDHDHIGDRAVAGALPKRNPQQQNEQADPVHDPADRQAGALRQALVQDVPGRQAEVGPHHQGDAQPEQHQPQVQVHQPAEFG
jgi:hypothetical protein